ncbi:hypothetical protein QWZ13_19295 [Reinekea marina]|nr:hypothetical protein [Reinekea marina]MDN3647305.1 hypothetical protein [Reinekea marina]MDN3651061.1 hypothetical protein [Reinekea marina]
MPKVALATANAVTNVFFIIVGASYLIIVVCLRITSLQHLN